MLNATKADELASLAQKQLEAGLNAKTARMDSVRFHQDLYNNKTLEVDADVFNIPFSYFSNFIDTFLSKIDGPPTVKYKIPNKPSLSEKVQAAWKQEMSSSRAGWSRKDRVEKKQALLSGRAVSKIYASSIDNKYKSHYDLVDIYSFVADPAHGRLEDGNYHGETDIFKTFHDIKVGVDAGLYSASQAEKLKHRRDDERSGNVKVAQNKFDRLKSLGVDIETTSYAGQEGALCTEWVMRHAGTWFYLLLEPKSGIWLRADELKNVAASGKTMFTSWATHYDEYAFWSKSLADDTAPVTEAMRFLLNNALENEKRRVRPMRLVESGSLLDINELQDYIPDNVILRQPGRDPNLVTIETPEIVGTINLLDFLDKTSQAKTGLQESGVDERDAKVGIFFGQLQQEADRIGVINKEYSESYADKGYNFFWGLKQHLTKPKQIEMQGVSGMKLQQLESFELKDVDDVDDVIVSGGSSEDELDAVEAERRLKALAELTAAYPQAINPAWVIKTTLKAVQFDPDDVEEALDVQGSVNRELMEEADQAIQEILLGETPDLNHGADVSFMQRIKDFVTNELNWVKLDKKGRPAGIDKKIRDQAQRLLAYMQAHQDIVIQNNLSKVRKAEFDMKTRGVLQPTEPGAEKGVNVPPPTDQQKSESLTRPFEGPVSSPSGSASAAQAISQTLRP